MIWHQRPLGIMYNILSLTNSTLLTADVILLCTRKSEPNSWLYCLYHRKMYIHLLVQYHLCPMTSCAPTKCNLYFDIPSDTVLNESECTSHITCPKSHVHFLWRKAFIQRIHLNLKQQAYFLSGGVVSPTIKTQAGRPPLVSSLQLLIQHIHTTLHISRPSLPSTTWGRTMPWQQGTQIIWWYSLVALFLCLIISIVYSFWL
jgi:hypothetical protein